MTSATAEKPETGQAAKTPSWRDALTVHPAAERFEMLNREQLQELARDIAVNGLREPVALFEDGRLLDGRNRLDALERFGVHLIDAGGNLCGQIPGPDGKMQPLIAPDRITGDPDVYVVSANVRRRHLTKAQRDAVVKEMIRANPDRSDRALAALAAIDDKTIAKHRNELIATGVIAETPVRVGRDGKAQSATKAKPAARKPARPSGSVSPMMTPTLFRGRKPKRVADTYAKALAKEHCANVEVEVKVTVAGKAPEVVTATATRS